MAKSKRVRNFIEEKVDAPAKKKKKKRPILFGLIFIGLLGLALGGFGQYYLKQQFQSPGPFSEATTFTVPKGAGVSTIAANLESQGLVRDARLFKLFVKMEGDDTGIKAGEFSLEPEASMSKIYETLASGKAILYPFTAPEGLTSAQIMRAMSRIETLKDDAPDTPPEGSLLPETYLTPRGMTRSALIKKMQDAQKAVIDEAWEDRQEGLPIKTKEEAIILASIVEKETGITGERDKVAGVFINRLNRGMRLESDPTIIYGVSKGEPLGRGIRRSEIDRKTDWNTYQIDRLPKTAICNPGTEAIRAVLNPAETDAIFFVADGTGGHVFAKTLKGHNNNVAKWRKIERQRKRDAAKKAQQGG